MRPSTTAVLSLAAVTGGAAAAPLETWTSADGRVSLRHPALVVPTTSDKPLGSMMSTGWRLVWDGKPEERGRLLVRFRLKVVPKPPEKTASEVLQIGESRDPEVVRTCTTFGLKGPDVKHVERKIGDVVFAGDENGDAGMSQSIRALDLRAVVGGSCYAVERFTYAESASDGDPSAKLPQVQGASMMDAMLDSLQIKP